MSRRIKSKTVKNWAEGVGLVGVPVLFAVFLMLSAQGDITINGYSGDMTCAGTIDDPCYAIINFTPKTDIFLYINETESKYLLGTDKELKYLKFERSWGNGWREINLNEGCSGSWCGCYWCRTGNTAKYSIVFRKGRNYTIRFTGYKENPFDDIKWSFTEKVDPVWYGLDWIKKDDKVYFNDSNVFIQTRPHTIKSSSQPVYFNFTSKVYSGNIDMLWGFDTDFARPKKAELRHKHTTHWNKTNDMTLSSVTDISTTTDNCDYGNEYNEIKREVTLNSTMTDVYCFDYYEDLGNDTYYIEWVDIHYKDKEWLDISDKLDSVNFDFQGFDKWYYVTDVPIQQDKNYQMRVKLNVRPNTEGKYFVALKPSSETISEAISNGHFYYLDPWWNSSYDYKRTQNNVSSLLTGLLIPLNSTGSGYSDIDSNGNNETYYGEYFDSTSSIYYNDENDTAYANDTDEGYKIQTEPQGETSGSIPSNLDLFYPFDNSTIVEYGNANSGSTNGNIPTVQGGYIGNSWYFDGSGDYITTSGLTLDDEGTCLIWMKPDFDGNSGKRSMLQDTDGSNWAMKWHVADWWCKVDGTYANAVNINDYVNQGSWYFYSCRWKTDDYAYVDVWNETGDHASDTTALGSSITSASNPTIGRQEGSTKYDYKGNMDNFICFDSKLSDAQVEAYYNVTKWAYLGSEETEGGGDSTSPTWRNIKENTGDPATYTYSPNYGFSVNCTDETSMGTPVFESNYTGSWSNISTSNPSGDLFTANITSASVSVINYSFVCIDGAGNENRTDWNTFTINVGTPSLSTSVTSPISYGTASDYSGSESNDGDSDLSYTLLRNGTQIDSGSSVSDNTILGARVYNYTYNTSGGANYTSASSEDILTITKSETKIDIYLNGTKNSDTYIQNQTAINITAVLNITGNIDSLTSNLTGWVSQSGSSPLENTSEVISCSSNETYYYFNATFNGNQNGTSTTSTYHAICWDVAPIGDFNLTYPTGTSDFVLNVSSCTGSGCYQSGTYQPYNQTPTTPLYTLGNNGTVVTDLSVGLSDKPNDCLYWYLSTNNTLEQELIDNLVGYWEFDEGTGSTVNDTSSNHNNGNISGASWVSGKYDSGLSFDGSNDYVDLDDINGSEGINKLTVCVWVYPIEDDVNHRIVSKKYNTAWSLDQRYFQITNSTGDRVYNTFDSKLTLNSWNHICGVYNGTYVISYIDGSESDVDSHIGTIGSNSGDLRIGSTPTGTSVFNGTIDEIKIYNTSLTQSQINQIYNREIDYLINNDVSKFSNQTIVENLSVGDEEELWIFLQAKYCSPGTSIYNTIEFQAE